MEGYWEEGFRDNLVIVEVVIGHCMGYNKRKKRIKAEDQTTPLLFIISNKGSLLP